MAENDVLSDEAVEAEAALETNAVGVAVALDEARADSTLRPNLEAFFAAQRGLIDAQKHHLHVQLRQLKLKIAGDRIRLTLQVLTLAAVIGLIVIVAVIVRDALDDHGLVIESFTAPPELATRGLTGGALADQLLGRIAAIRRIANANSITVSDDVRSGGSDSLKVEIPETGLSLDQIERFLHQSLGHARRLVGMVSERDNGRVAIELSLSGADPIHVEGDAADLDKLIQQAAERAFAAFDPVNYVIYLHAVDRNDEALAAAERNFKIAQTPIEIYDGLSLWADNDGDRRRAVSKATLATQTYPKGWAGWSELADSSQDLGHDEAALAALRRLLKTNRADQWRNHREAFPYILRGGRMRLDRALGDYGQLDVDTRQDLSHDLRNVSTRFQNLQEVAADRHDCGLAWRNYGFAQTTGPMSPTNDLKARWSLAVCADDWPAALSAAQGLTTMVAAQAAEAQVSFRGFYTNPLATLYQPRLALALARTGRLAEAGDLISALPLDCYLCLRTRGAIAAASGEARDADHWFAEAVRQGPSLPFAYLEWARAKLARGDAAGAIAQLAIARAKAPKFADIDELWGEALARRGDLRGAVTRYARADALAPHWGRLHKEWGEALQRLGRIGEARTQFAAAARMDLSNADRAELARRGG